MNCSKREFVKPNSSILITEMELANAVIGIGKKMLVTIGACIELTINLPYMLLRQNNKDSN